MSPNNKSSWHMTKVDNCKVKFNNFKINRFLKVYFWNIFHSQHQQQWYNKYARNLTDKRPVKMSIYPNDTHFVTVISIHISLYCLTSYLILPSIVKYIIRSTFINLHLNSYPILYKYTYQLTYYNLIHNILYVSVSIHIFINIL